MEHVNESEMSLSEQAIQSVVHGQLAFCKFLSANDTGLTGGHQSGIYVPMPAREIIFDVAGERGSNMKRTAKIRWQIDFETESSFTYYGRGTRNEYRITRFGRGFDLLRVENTGAFAVIVKRDKDEYEGWVLETEEEINEFLDYFGMSPVDTGNLIQISGLQVRLEEQQEKEIQA